MAQNKKVLVHYFNASYRYYEESKLVTYAHGQVGPPGLATEIPPPVLICAEGYIPVFTVEKKWVIKENTFWKPIFINKHYHAGYIWGHYIPFALSLGDFPLYKSLPQIFTNVHLPFLIQQKIRNIHNKYYQLNVLYSKTKGNFQGEKFIPIDGPKLGNDGMHYHASPSFNYEYHFVAEELITCMKSILDYLVQLTSIMVDRETSVSKNKVLKSELGNLGAINTPSSVLEKLICGDGEGYMRDNSEFLTIINELSNSIKHSMIHCWTYNEYPDSEPIILSYQAKSNKFSNPIIYHCHSLEQLMIGFRNTVKRLLWNQKRYSVSE
ncbi:hypothetical protein AB4323_20570 [Vibrio sp. 10N.261.52.C11]|uniref:hypothetical protein n=1 Tax=Vibrio sp. 10N.261.52.C11 TaxID=3229680 RepID=UPI00354F483E